MEAPRFIPTMIPVYTAGRDYWLSVNEGLVYWYTRWYWFDKDFKSHSHIAVLLSITEEEVSSAMSRLKELKLIDEDGFAKKLEESRERNIDWKVRFHFYDDYHNLHQPKNNYIAVDWGCLKNPGGFSDFKVVYVDDAGNVNEVVYKYYPNWTTNLAEYMALVYALMFRKNSGNENAWIYTDSKNAIYRGVKAGSNAKVDLSQRLPIKEDLAYFDNRLKENWEDVRYNIWFWEWRYWGENPADMLRKSGRAANLPAQIVAEQKKRNAFASFMQSKNMF